MRKLLFLVWVVLLPSYSYSESLAPYYGYTGNAAEGGLNWDMGVVLPTPPGLDINGVIYNYTINKNVEDSVKVHVQNENANGTGYIFRETDDWLPGSLGGTEINKVVPVVPGIPRSYWGNGSITTEGDGSVSDARVVYTYRVDPCFDPQYDPNCPGYQVPKVEIPVIDSSLYEVDLTSLYDVTDDENVDLNEEACKEGDNSVKCLALKDEENKESEEDEEKEETKEEKEKRLEKEKREKAMAAQDKVDSITFFAQNNALFANALAQNAALQSMQTVNNLNSYYSTTIPGGSYKESVVLKDSQLPENKRGLRNGLAQQVLHEQMIDMQYK